LLKSSFLPQIRFVHQLREANATITFYTRGDHFNELAARVSADLTYTGFRPVPSVTKRKGGLAGLKLVSETSALDHFRPFEEQAEAVQEGIRITRDLRDWFVAQQDTVRRWAPLVPEN